MPTAGIEFEHTGAPGSALLTVSSVSRDRQQVFRIPLTEPSTILAATGEYFWHLEGTRTSIVYLKNMTSEPRGYHLFLRHEQGVWSFGLKTLAPHQSTAIDIGEIRATQLADVKGRTIPLNVAKGQVHWSIVGGTDPKAIDGRMEQVDVAVGVSSTYACGTFQPDKFDYAWIEPNETPEIEVDQIFQFDVWEQDVDFLDHHPEDPINITSLLTWTNDDSAIASSAGPGSYMGESEGNASEEAYGESVGWDEHMNHVPLSVEFDMQVKPKCWEVMAFQKVPGQVYKVNERRLHFEYKWESSSGSVQDLHAQGAQIHEKVSYDKVFANPPWNQDAPVPPSKVFERSIAANSGASPNNQWAQMVDEHGTGLPTTPYAEDTITGTQVYSWTSTCKTTAVNLATYTIKRQIYSYDNCTKWGVKTEKDGLNGDYKPLAEPDPPTECFYNPQGWVGSMSILPGQNALLSRPWSKNALRRR